MSDLRITNDDELRTYIDLFKISDRKYIIGIFQEGITISKQQVRALNIFQALVKTNKIDLTNKRFSIGIVGAGIAGLTFAAAAAKRNIKVTILEQHSIFMHMQYGCDTRVVHPNIYHWPSKGCEFPYATTPILQWKAGTASNVAQQIVDKFHRIRTQSKSKEIKAFVDCNITEIDDIPGQKITIRASSNQESIVRKVDLVIFATGYGIEKGVSSVSKTPSYWRNDNFAQTILTDHPEKYLLSGVGDGGLLDLFRLKFLGFSIKSFLQKLSKCPSCHVLYKKLEAIKQKWSDLDTKDKRTDWLQSSFEQINPKLYLPLLSGYFQKRHIKKCILTVHGQEKSFMRNLNLSKVSMLNAFIAYLIARSDGYYFTYTSAELKEHNGHYTLDGHDLNGTKVIIRHGTIKSKAPETFLSNDNLTTFREIEIKQKAIKLYNNTDLIFGYSSLYSLLNDISHGEYSFYTPETESICSSFVAVLANAILYHQNKAYPSNKFRVCLHRVINPSEKSSSVSYQQITPYYGNWTTPENTDPDTPNRSIGRVYPLKHGIVGKSVMTGKIVHFRKEDPNSSYEEMLTQLNLTENKRYGDSALSIPIWGKLASGKYAVNLVCFLESDECNFFITQDLKALIIFAMEGFMNYINKSLDKEIIMSEVDFEPHVLEDHAHVVEENANPMFERISNTFNHLTLQKLPLKFNKFHSFDITYNETEDNLHLYMDET